VFVDTSALFAVLDASDQNHGAAREIWARALERSSSLVTSNYVGVETLALVQRRLGIQAVGALVERVFPVLDLRFISPELHAAAIESLLTSNRRGLSFVDCTSFALMRRLGLERVFAFDRHFAEQGFGVAPDRS